MVRGDFTLGSEHRIQCTDNVSKNCIREAYTTFLTSVIPYIQ